MWQKPPKSPSDSEKRRGLIFSGIESRFTKSSWRLRRSFSRKTPLLKYRILQRPQLPHWLNLCRWTLLNSLLSAQPIWTLHFPKMQKALNLFWEFLTFWLFPWYNWWLMLRLLNPDRSRRVFGLRNGWVVRGRGLPCTPCWSSFKELRRGVFFWWVCCPKVMRQLCWDVWGLGTGRIWGDSWHDLFYLSPWQFWSRKLLQEPVQAPCKSSLSWLCPERRI